jgi:outer membrane protein TolC
LLTFPNSFWSIGSTAILTIFDAGRRKAEVERARAIKDETAAQYRATVLRAFKEVEDNLALLRQLHEEAASEQAAVVSAQRNLDLATNRYREGIVSYLDVIDAEETALRTKTTALDITTRSLLASIGLIRAIGGGWTEGRDPAIATDPKNARPIS